MHPKISSWRVTFLYQDCRIQNKKLWSFIEHSISPPKTKLVFVSSMQHIHHFSETQYWSLKPFLHSAQTFGVCTGNSPLLASIKNCKVWRKTLKWKAATEDFQDTQITYLRLSTFDFPHTGQIEKMSTWETFLNISFWDNQNIAKLTLLRHSLDSVPVWPKVIGQIPNKVM